MRRVESIADAHCRGADWRRLRAACRLGWHPQRIEALRDRFAVGVAAGRRGRRGDRHLRTRHRGETERHDELVADVPRRALDGERRLTLHKRRVNARQPNERMNRWVRRGA